MGSKIDGELLYNWLLQLQRVIKLFWIEQVLEVTKPESNTFGDGLSSITRVEHAVANCFGKQINNGVWKILDFVYHDVMYLWAGVTSEPNKVEHVINSIHHVIAPIVYFPSLVLAKGFIDIQFLLFSEERIARFGNVDFFGQIKSRVQMSVGSSFDGRVDLSPNQMRGNVTCRVMLMADIRPEVSKEVVVIHFE